MKYHLHFADEAKKKGGHLLKSTEGELQFKLKSVLLQTSNT